MENGHVTADRTNQSTIEQRTEAIKRQTFSVEQRTELVERLTGTIERRTFLAERQTLTVERRTLLIEQQTFAPSLELDHQIVLLDLISSTFFRQFAVFTAAANRLDIRRPPTGGVSSAVNRLDDQQHSQFDASGPSAKPPNPATPPLIRNDRDGDVN